jgi:hypothetical protein
VQPGRVAALRLLTCRRRYLSRRAAARRARSCAARAWDRRTRRSDGWPSRWFRDYFAASMNLRIDIATGDVVLAAWERVLLAVFIGKTTVQAVRRSAQVVTELYAAQQRPVLVLTVVEEHAIMPSLDVRMELVACLKRFNGLVERSAVVFEGEGFRAATVRSIVAGVSLFSRPDYPHRVFASVGAAARFLGNGNQESLAPHRVIRMVQEARRAQGTQPFLPWLQTPLSAKPSTQVR